LAGALKELEDFEAYADAEITKLALWGQPVRSILSLIYLSADGQYVGTRFKRSGQRDDEVGTAMITRMSYVFRLFAKCPRVTGADIDDACLMLIPALVRRESQRAPRHLWRALAVAGSSRAWS
jgi:hypothetical protein